MDAAGPVQGDFQWTGLWTCDFAKSGAMGHGDYSFMNDRRKVGQRHYNSA